jgi:ankyrin repeat protein
VLTRRSAPQDGCTPLFITALVGHVEVAQVLIQAGANREAKNKVRAKRGGDEGR